MKRLNGSITIYFTFAIILIISVIMSVTEMARINCQKLYLQLATDASIDSMASLFHRDLYKYYNLYGVEYRTLDMLKTEYISYMEPFLSDGVNDINNWYIGKIDENSVDLKFKLLMEDGNFEKEIINYMKYDVVGKAISFLGRDVEIKDEDDLKILESSAKEIFDEVEKGDIYKEVYERYFDFAKDIKILEKHAKNINYYVKLVNNQISAVKSISTTGSLSNGSTVLYKFDTLNNDINIFNRELKNYKNYMAEFREKVNKSRNNYLSDKELKLYSFTDDVIEFIESEFEKFISFVDEDSPMNKAIDKGFYESDIIKDHVAEDKEIVRFYVSNLESIESELAIERRKHGEDRDGDYIRDLIDERKALQDDFKDALKEIKENYKDYKIDNIEIEVSTADNDSDESLIDKLIGFKNGLVLNMVLDNEAIEKISKDVIGIRKFNILSNNKDVSINKVLLGEYEIDKFNYYNKELNDEVTKSGSIALEVERLISGKNADIDNLKDVINKILLIRIALDVLYIYTHADKREAVRAWTIKIFGGFSLMLAEAMFLVVLTAWGTAQALADVKKLLNGKKVSLIHTDESWTVSIDNILDVARNGISESIDEDDRGISLNYKDYLRLLLLTTNQNEIDNRMIGIMENNIKVQQANFDFEKLIFSFETENSFICEHFFTNFVFVDAKDINLADKYKIKTKAYRGFYE